MAVTIKTKTGAASSTKVEENAENTVIPEENAEPVKKAGRPKGSKNKGKRSTHQYGSVIRESKRAALLAGKIQDTADMTDDELLKRAREIPDGRGSPGGQNAESLNEITAERSALAYRLMIRGLNEQQIADQMGVSLGTVARYIKHVKGSLNLDPKKLDVGYYMGESLAFYQEIRQMALLQASNGTNSANTKLAAMRVALEAEERKNGFLQKIGVYSPTVVERIERVVFAETAKTFNHEEQEERPKVNLAAELGRIMALSNQQYED